jgi:hypothetical protein
MTCATVAEIVTRVDGALVTLKYKDGEKTVATTSDSQGGAICLSTGQRWIG